MDLAYTNENTNPHLGHVKLRLIDAVVLYEKPWPLIASKNPLAMILSLFFMTPPHEAGSVLNQLIFPYLRTAWTYMSTFSIGVPTSGGTSQPLPMHQWEFNPRLQSAVLTS